MKIIICFCIWSAAFLIGGTVLGVGIVQFINPKFDEQVHLYMGFIIGFCSLMFGLLLSVFGLLPGLSRLGSLPTEIKFLEAGWVMIGSSIILYLSGAQVSDFVLIERIIFILQHTSTTVKVINLDPSFFVVASSPLLLFVSYIGCLSWIARLLRYIPRINLTDGRSSGFALGPAEAEAYWRAAQFAALLFFILVLERIILGRFNGVMGQQVGTRNFFSLGLVSIVQISLITVAAPICEEIVFRGVCFASFSRSLGAKWAMIITTAVFVSLHIANASEFFLPNILAIGVSCCLLRLKYYSVRPCIFLHSLYNLSVYITAALF